MEGTETVTEVRQRFVDILEDRRTSSDFLWASRVWNPKSAYEQNQKYIPSQIKSLVLRSNYLKQTLKKISQNNSTPMDNLHLSVRQILDEMGYESKVYVLRWLGYFVAKILKKFCHSVYVNKSKFLEIKSKMGSNPVLFVPTHRSYADFILMSYVCFHYDVDIPRIAAGMDFHSMALMGKILRYASAFFIRRSFVTDAVYSAVFSEYLRTLVTKGDASIEFFIEGTRSRTAKSLMPKYGFLSEALKPFFSGQVPDVSIVPVNLSYDRILEEVLFAYELLGIPKPKESTKGFVKALSALDANYGNIYIQFGDPFSVKKIWGDKIDRSIHGVGPVDMQELTPSESKEIIRVAHAIIQKQNALTTLNCFNLISAVMNNYIIEQFECLNVESLNVNDLVTEVRWLLSVMKVLTNNYSCLPMNDINLVDVQQHLKLHKSLIHISTNDKIYLNQIHSRNVITDHSKLKGHTLSDNTMDVAIPLLMLQYYVNPCAHFIFSVCFIVQILHSVPDDSVLPIDQLFREFKLLCSIFSYEFVLFEDYIPKEFSEALEYGHYLKILLKEDDNNVKKGNNKKLHSFCINFLKSYIPGYIAVAEILIESAEVLSEKQILTASQARVESKLNSKYIIHPYNLSLDVLLNALKSFVALGVVSKTQRGNGVKYIVKEPELQKIYSKLLSFDIQNKSAKFLRQSFSVFIRSTL